jgi:hypothetical protein
MHGTTSALHGAQETPDTPSTTQNRDPFSRNNFGIEFGGGGYVESWNLNGSREWIVEGTAGGWWTIADEVMMIGQFHGSHVDQTTVPDAFLNGLTILTRVRLWEDDNQWDPFLEIGPGMVLSNTSVPAGGTEFNFLIVAGVGASRRVSPRTHFTTGFRWFHLSNANREGDSRNPDIQALGGFAALTIGF